MKPDFMVVSLPRSRSAWLANFLTTDKTLCVHDPIGRAAMGIEIARDHRLYGVSDTAIAWHPEVVNDMPCPKVVIERDLVDVHASLHAIGFGFQPPMTALAVQRELLGLVKDALRVRFDDIDQRLEEIWAHCTGGLPFDAPRAEQLKGFNIELSRSMLLRAAATLNKEAA